MSLPVAEFDVDGEFETAQPVSMSIGSLSKRDRNGFYFLTMLYYLQGVPVGLAFGSVPFILKEHLSYGQIGIFSFASYPYSLKLLWSPIVDAFFWPRFGRRRSWIVPIQLFSALVLLILSFRIDDLLKTAETKLPVITGFFFVLVFASATQDIAVDGWSLTLLSKPALPYASTAQTIGINSGYFTSFTVFLALSSPELANRYFRSVPRDEGLVSFPEYLRLCSFAYLAVTAFVAFFYREDKEDEDLGQNAWQSTKHIYHTMFGVLQLENMQKLILVHLVAKIAFQAAEAVTNLKLVEKGLSKEDLAVIVLIDFPFEIIFGYMAAKWSTRWSPLQPWLIAFVGRLIFAVISMSQVFFFPKQGATFTYLVYVTVVHVLGSFLSTVQFVSICAFHTQIADPLIGGTYMTVLNTISNFGGTWPRALVLAGVDWFTTATCSATGDSCTTEPAKQRCRDLDGVCTTQRDGYYVMNIVCIIAGVLLFYGFIKRTLERLQNLPTQAWRSKKM